MAWMVVAISEAAKNLCCNLVGADQKTAFNFVTRGSMKDDEFFAALLGCEVAEVVCPSALRYQVTDAAVGVMLEKTWKGVPAGSRFLVPGANNAYGVQTATGLDEDRTGAVAARLRAERVCTVPDWVANSGTAQVPLPSVVCCGICLLIEYV